MFTTLKSRLFLGVYIFIILSIPVGAYLASENQEVSSKATDTKDTKKSPVTSPIPSPKPTTSAAKELLDLSEKSGKDIDSPDSADELESLSPTIATSFGPTLSLSATLEGRNEKDQSTKLFIGIVEGTLTSNPKFVLNFTVNLPSSGSYSNLSLAGLSTGSKYTALLKGSAQIATSSAFTMSPTVSKLNDGKPLNLLTGDLNDDNVINTADFAIVIGAFGATVSSKNWNSVADLNKDGIINTVDLAFVIKNMGKAGASGAWTSPLPQLTGSPGEATPEASAQGGIPNNSKGYWIWVPHL